MLQIVHCIAYQCINTEFYVQKIPVIQHRKPIFNKREPMTEIAIEVCKFLFLMYLKTFLKRSLSRSLD